MNKRTFNITLSVFVFAFPFHCMCPETWCAYIRRLESEILSSHLDLGNRSISLAYSLAHFFSFFSLTIVTSSTCTYTHTYIYTYIHTNLRGGEGGEEENYERKIQIWDGM